MTISRIDDFSNAMVAELLEQYRNSPNIKKMLEIKATSIQEVEDLFDQMRNEVNLQNGYGAILDRIGGNLGEFRRGLSDDEYRLNIYTRIAINTGGCDPEFILRTVRQLIDPVSIIYRPLYPANYSLEIRKDNLDPDVIPLIRSLSPAGVGEVIITNTPEAELFRFGGVINSSYQLILNDQGEQFPLALEDIGDIIYTLAVMDLTLLAAPDSEGFGGIIPNEFLATTDVDSTIAFEDGSPWRLVSEGDEEFYTTTEYGGVFSGVL